MVRIVHLFDLIRFMSLSPYIFGSVPKLPAKYAAVVIPFILSFMMSGLISMINIIHNIGFVEHFAAVWISAWFFSWCVAFPAVLILLPIVRRITARLVDFSKI